MKDAYYFPHDANARNDPVKDPPLFTTGRPGERGDAIAGVSRRPGGQGREREGGLTMQVEIRPYTWRKPGDEYDSYARYFPFVDGKPRHDIRCATHCTHYSEETLMSAYGPCNCKLLAAGKLVEGLYCGPICGSFRMRGED